VLASLEILRPSNGIMAAAFFVIGAAMAGVSLVPIPLTVLTGMLVVFMVSGAGMAINDYYDFEIDKVNRPLRVLPSGRMKPRTAYYYASLLFVAACAIAYTLNIYMFGFAIFNSIVSCIYARYLKKTPYGHFAVSWLVASVFLFASLLTGVSDLMLVLFGMAFSINTAREIAKAIEDILGDRKYGVNSLPVTIGRLKANKVIYAFTAVGVLLTPIPYLMNAVGAYYVPVAVLADALAIYAAYKVALHPGKSQRMMKLAMLAAIIAFLAGLV